MESRKRGEKRHDDLLGEQSLTEERDTQGQVLQWLARCETQGGSKSRRQTIQGDGHSCGSRSPSVASPAFTPRHPPMGTLCAGKEQRLPWRRNLSRRTQQDIDPLAAHEPQPLPSRLASTPVSPQERGGSSCRSGHLGLTCRFGTRAQDGTHPARLLRKCTVSLASFSQWTGTTMSHAGGIHDLQCAITLFSPFLHREGMARRTAQGSIRLAEKLAAGQASHPRTSDHLGRA